MNWGSTWKTIVQYLPRWTGYEYVGKLAGENDAASKKMTTSLNTGRQILSVKNKKRHVSYCTTRNLSFPCKKIAHHTPWIQWQAPSRIQNATQKRLEVSTPDKTNNVKQRAEGLRRMAKDERKNGIKKTRTATATTEIPSRLHTMRPRKRGTATAATRHNVLKKQMLKKRDTATQTAAHLPR